MCYVVTVIIFTTDTGGVVAYSGDSDDDTHTSLVHCASIDGSSGGVALCSHCDIADDITYHVAPFTTMDGR